MNKKYKKIENFFYKKTKNIIMMVDSPIKSFKEIEEIFKDNIDGRITKDTFPTRRLSGLKIIEFFKSSAKTIPFILAEMEKNGYTPAPAEYFVKGTVNPAPSMVVCLDPKITLPDNRVLTINYTFDEPLLDAHPASFLGQYGEDWYAVIAITN